MKIKRLSKEESLEGLTLELVNSIDMEKNFSPIQLRKDDEPVKLLQSLTGYNVLYDDNKVLKDNQNKPFVLNVRECQIGRARYLLKFLDKEKNEKTMELVESWRQSTREHLDQVKMKIALMESCEWDFLIEKTNQAAYEKY